jgi:2-polyprenyl-6-methoxyphenol hydroxylase-like FAD-dependent oxidoreductase
MDVLWFRLPRVEGDPEGVFGRFGGGHGFAFLDRGDQWQIAGLILKGSYRQVREAGVEKFRQTLAETEPLFAERAALLTDWKQVAMLSVESSRLPRWYKPGLLLIGDAAHVMSPVGGVGINYAIQDAVVAANVLAEPLASNTLTTDHLRQVQRRREWPTKIIQAIQTQLQKRVIAAALNPDVQFSVPLLLRLILKVPFLRDIPARIIGFGVWRVKVKQ